MLTLFLPAFACVIETTDLSWGALPVTAGDHDFRISLEGADVLVTTEQPDQVVVTGPLAFTTHVGRLPLHTAEPLELYRGVLTLPTELFVELEPDRAPIEGVPVRLPARELVAEELEVPCASLTLIDRPHPGRPALLEPEDPADEVYLHGPTPFHRSRFHSDPWVIDVNGPLHVEVRRPGWVRVAAIWDDGTEVRGWVEQSATYRPHLRTRSGYGRLRLGRAGCSRSHGPPLESVSLPAGTAIHTEPHGPAWATYTEPVEVRVFTEPVEGWLRVAHTPGLASPLCGEHDRLWVRQDSVH